jgi:hypothetical protein
MFNIAQQMEMQNEHSAEMYQGFLEFINLINYTVMVRDKFDNLEEQMQYVEATLQQFMKIKQAEIEAEFGWVNEEDINHSHAVNQKIIKECALQELIINLRSSLKGILEDTEEIDETS